MLFLQKCNFVTEFGYGPKAVKGDGFVGNWGTSRSWTVRWGHPPKRQKKIVTCPRWDRFKKAPGGLLLPGADFIP
jgi:hypothetical protein